MTQGPKLGNTVCETTIRAQQQAATMVNNKKPVCEPCRLFRWRACAWLCLTATQKHGGNYCNDKMDTTNMSFPLKRTRNSVLRWKCQQNIRSTKWKLIHRFTPCKLHSARFCHLREQNFMQPFWVGDALAKFFSRRYRSLKILTVKRLTEF